VIQTLFPEYDWRPWKFFTHRYWDEEDNVQTFFNHLKNKYSIQEPSDWQRKISRRMLLSEGGAGLLSKYGSFKQALKTVYPSVDWDSLYLASQCSQPHTQLVKQLHALQIAPDIQINYKPNSFKHPSSGFPMEFDIFVPSLKLVNSFSGFLLTFFKAFECQGGQHYNDNPYWASGKLASQQRRDKEKREACQQNGITLLELSLHEWKAKSTADDLKKLLQQRVPHVFVPLQSSTPSFVSFDCCQIMH
jgi:hypothetical protein